MRLLILTAFYPVPGVTHERMFVHVRNCYYQTHGGDVTVLNFATKENYKVDGIKVITQDEYERDPGEYDIVISHSANVRNHYCFLKKHEKKFKHLVFFFHGHETSIFAKDYPKPYSFTSDGRFPKYQLQYAYDVFKLKVWRPFYIKLAYKSHFIFVSEHFYKRVQKNLKVTPAELKNHCHVINNSIGSFFETAVYDSKAEKKYDFICIRSNLDASKYCVDLVWKLAKKRSERKFLIIGKGNFFKYHQMPPNMVWINHTLDHEEMLSYLNQSRCGLMLTRSDTQGVMACEMASTGMPLISSDIEVCWEILSVFPNVALVANEVDKIDLDNICNKLEARLPYQKCKEYYAENTIRKEMELFRKLMEEG